MAKRGSNSKNSASQMTVDRWVPDETVYERVAEALGRRWRKSDIVRLICHMAGEELGKKDQDKKPYHKVCRAKIEEILRDARKIVIATLDLDVRDQKGLALEFYQSMIRDPATTATERIRAQERIDAILGLDAKFGSKSEPAEVLARKMREAAALMELSIPEETE